MKLTRVGIDLAESVFPVHGVDERAMRLFASSSDGSRRMYAKRQYSYACELSHALLRDSAERRKYVCRNHVDSARAHVIPDASAS